VAAPQAAAAVSAAAGPCGDGGTAAHPAPTPATTAPTPTAIAVPVSPDSRAHSAAPTAAATAARPSTAACTGPGPVSAVVTVAARAPSTITARPVHTACTSVQAYRVLRPSSAIAAITSSNSGGGGASASSVSSSNAPSTTDWSASVRSGSKAGRPTGASCAAPGTSAEPPVRTGRRRSTSSVTAGSSSATGTSAGSARSTCVCGAHTDTRHQRGPAPSGSGAATCAASVAS